MLHGIWRAVGVHHSHSQPASVLRLGVRRLGCVLCVWHMSLWPPAAQASRRARCSLVAAQVASATSPMCQCQSTGCPRFLPSRQIPLSQRHTWVGLCLHPIYHSIIPLAFPVGWCPHALQFKTSCRVIAVRCRWPRAHVPQTPTRAFSYGQSRPIATMGSHSRSSNLSALVPARVMGKYRVVNSWHRGRAATKDSYRAPRPRTVTQALSRFPANGRDMNLCCEPVPCDEDNRA
jgi:hypothetical protein